MAKESKESKISEYIDDVKKIVELTTKSYHVLIGKVVEDLLNKIKSTLITWTIAVVIIATGTVYLLVGLVNYLYFYINLSEPKVDLLFGLALISVGLFLFRKQK